MNAFIMLDNNPEHSEQLETHVQFQTFLADFIISLGMVYSEPWYLHQAGCNCYTCESYRENFNKAMTDYVD